MIIETEQTVKEKDGVITAYVSFKDDITGKLLRKSCIQGSIEADFEKQIQKIADALDVETAAKETDKQIVDSAIEKVKTKLQESK